MAQLSFILVFSIVALIPVVSAILSSLKPIRSTLTVKRGHSASLVCMGQNIERWDSFLSWKFNGADIEDGKNRKVFETFLPESRKVNFSLLISNVSEKDVGTYTCEVDLHQSEEHITLKLYQEVVNVTTPEELVVVDEGSTKRVLCNVTFSEAADIDVGWLLNGEIVKRHKRLKNTQFLWSDQSYLTDKVKIFLLPLELKHASHKHNGLYTCFANSSTVYSAKNITVHLNNTRGVNLLASESIVVAKKGSNVTLSCHGVYPNTAFEDGFWLFNGSRIHDNALKLSSEKKYKITKERFVSGTINRRQLRFMLTIFRASLHDTGIYTCFLNTSHGFKQENITLFVEKHVNTNVLVPKSTGIGALLYTFIGLGTLIGLVGTYLIFRQIRKRPREPRYSETLRHKNYEYDVFVTYSSKDSWWVDTQLLTLLRNHHVNVCIHHLNWELGMSIFDNMVNSVRQSRKILVVWSRGYATSKYCQLELYYAMQRSVEEGDYSLIIMRLDKTKVKQLPKPLRNRTFLDYCHSAERAGWENRLIKHLKVVPKCQTVTLV